MSSIFDNGKTAQQISTVHPEDGNTYELDIHAAACLMVRTDRGDWRYQTHYSSGSTVWSIGRVLAADTVTIPRAWRRA
jgi:hypothetical protein